jgi:hypothetical protein
MSCALRCRCGRFARELKPVCPRCRAEVAEATAQLQRHQDNMKRIARESVAAIAATYGTMVKAPTATDQTVEFELSAEQLERMLSPAVLLRLLKAIALKGLVS